MIQDEELREKPVTDILAAVLPPMYLAFGLLFGGMFLFSESRAHAFLSILFLAVAAFAAWRETNDLKNKRK